ncbi:hypothetical protein [Candidatus Magnetobacterium casense]|uniref:Uncharacterized protein n=1 Tax=Candidatus Magnetobacterium casense TaxID=1455061 RepID=A0ABS6RXQ3_9BACT|nr:hypothetical protein [Candidatus Magnetobacterium casensis]MBV6341212.1 hypothetical protein [Candidatus Magnetobacterium casensis]
MTIRRVVVIGAVIVVLLLVGNWCLGKMQTGMGSQNSPVNTAKGAVMAMEAMNPEKVVAYFTPIPGQIMATRLANTFSKMDKLDIQNFKGMLILQEGAAARVQVTYDMVFTQGGYVNTEHCAKTLKLVNPDGKKWYVNEVF